LKRLVLTEAGARALVRGIEESNIESFTVKHSIRAIPAKESGYIYEKLYKGIRASPTVQVLKLPHVPISGMIDGFDHMPSLCNLALDNLIMTWPMTQDFAECICQSTVKQLELKGMLQDQPEDPARIR